MKKLLFILTLSMFLIAGCDDYTDQKETISVHVDQEFVITVGRVDPSTGYSLEESHDAMMVSLVERKIKPDMAYVRCMVSPKPGCSGGIEYFRFKALKTGRTEITFTSEAPYRPSIGEPKIFNVDIK